MYRTTRLSRRAAVLATSTATVAALALVPAGAALGAPAAKGCENRNNTTLSSLLECVDADGAMEHMVALQEIADANGGNRAAGTEGYEQSVQYVVETLEAAGWDVSIDEFDYTYFGPASLSQLTPIQADYNTGAFSGTGAGDVTGNVVPVDLDLGLGNTSTSGCQPEDFAGLDFSGPNDIALVQRGACNFGDKALNAETAGAEAVVIFNQGNTAERTALIVANAGTLTDARHTQ